MNSWSISRKRFILFLVLIVLAILIGIPTYFLFYRVPTCSDGKLNGDESGIDCGGSCQKLCTPEALPIISEGDAQVLTVATSTYEVVAEFRNPNPTAEIYRARYTVKLFNESMTAPIKIIEGDTYVAKNKSFAVFVGPFTMTESTSTRATFEWNSKTLAWKRDLKETADISIFDKVISGEESSPLLQATAKNDSLLDARNIEFIALLYDEEGNTVAASKTYLDSLSRGESQPIIFTWSTPFKEKVVSVKIISRIYPDGSFFK